MSVEQVSAVDTVWLSDFTPVPASARRTARYALQMIARCPDLHLRLRDDDFLGPLWMLTLPLIDPVEQDALMAEWMRPDDTERHPDLDAANSSAGRRRRLRNQDPFLLGAPGERMREDLIDLFSAVPEAVLERLAKEDGTAPAHVSVAVLAQCVGLDEIDAMILDFVEKKDSSRYFRPFLRGTSSESPRDHYTLVSAALGVPAATLKGRFQPNATLPRLQLAEALTRRSDLEDFIRSGDLFKDIVTLEPTSADALLAILIEPASAPECTLDDFPHLASDAARSCAVIAKAAATRTKGVNALLYGPPGCGKTQFASAVAQAAGLQAYRVKTADSDGDGLSREGRLGAYQLTQRLLSGRTDCVVVFDEVEDAFARPEGAFLALFGGEPVAGNEKGWMNRTLEDNPVPAIWITNNASGMDRAFVRRFLLPVAFSTPPRRVRRQMVERHLGEAGVPTTLLDELAADAALMPAQFSDARRLLALYDDVSPEKVVREGVAAARRVLHGAASPRMRRPATAFDVAYLNLAGGITPARLAEALARTGRGSLCFFGAPGTGKTEFAHVLADALDRELVVKASSDLVSPYVGQTERNIAQLFAELDADHSVLLLDEIDSLLRDRRQARHSWEAVQVNELLQQMERFSGIFIAATNMLGQLDAAAMRRFDFKLQFRPLNRAQRLSLFAREALGDERAREAMSPALVARLDQLEMLTPGDFANVVRQRDLLGEALTPEEFLRRLIVECRYKEGLQAAA